MLDMKNDLILNKNFWQEYRLNFDYETLELRVRNEDEKYVFSKMKNQRSRLQILDNQSFEAEKVERRVFEKLLRKNVETFPYVIRDEEFILELIFVQ